MRRVVVMLLIGCAPVEPEASEPAAPATATSVPDELRGVVAPWHAVEPEWLQRASVWLVAEYQQSTYPCVEGPDGSLDMLQRDSLVPTRTLRGRVALASLDIDPWALRGPGFPTALTEGRSYLVLLSPTPTVAAKLADPEGHFNMHERLGRADVVALVDLSQSAAEAATGKIAASRSGTIAGDRFDPALWAAARDATTVTAAQHGPVARFLAAQLLRESGTALTDVRAWVGAPDVELRSAHGLTYRYWLARERYEQPREGAIYGQLELQFVDDVLRRGSLRWFRWQVTPQQRTSIAIPTAELAPLGLAEFRLGLE
jgi:hypothetical protein